MDKNGNTGFCHTSGLVSILSSLKLKRKTPVASLKAHLFKNMKVFSYQPWLKSVKTVLKPYCKLHF